MTEQTAATAPKAKKEIVIETVTMKDGSIVDFAGTKQLLKTDVEVGGMPGVRFDFRNGETRTVLIDIGALGEKLAQHGLKQKIGDETAGLKDLNDAVMAVDDLIDRLTKGEFNAVREAGSMAGASILLQALLEVFGKSAEVLKPWLAGKSNEQKKALKADPKVAPVIQRIESERAAKSAAKAKVDVGSLVGELEGM
jgi:hypothetical protein